MIDKRVPHYVLAEIKTAFSLPTSLVRTFSATMGAEALGMDETDVVAVIQSLEDTDFYKSMTSYADATVWQDVYKPSTAGKQLYVKFTQNTQGDLLLISFKEA